MDSMGQKRVKNRVSLYLYEVFNTWNFAQLYFACPY